PRWLIRSSVTTWLWERSAARSSRSSATLMADFYLGLDLGQAADYTAIAVLERTPSPEERRPQRPDYALRYLERPPLGTTYPDIVVRVVELVNTEPLRHRSALVVDQTGVGRPVVDLLIAAGLRPIAVTITGGDTVTRVEQEY